MKMSDPETVVETEGNKIIIDFPKMEENRFLETFTLDVFGYMLVGWCLTVFTYLMWVVFAFKGYDLHPFPYLSSLHLGVTMTLTIMWIYLEHKKRSFTVGDNVKCQMK